MSLVYGHYSHKEIGMKNEQRRTRPIQDDMTKSTVNVDLSIEHKATSTNQGDGQNDHTTKDRAH